VKSDSLGSVVALNFHVWQPCNMGCSYCFAEFSDSVQQLQVDKAQLRQRALTVIEAAAKAGIRKLTLVGGEPTLCPWLLDLLQHAKSLGLVTMLVSNGAKMQENAWLPTHAPWLDWVALSIDSTTLETNRKIGRVVGRKFVPDGAFYRTILQSLHAAGCRLKVNTVVSSLNWQEDFTAFLQGLHIERWKVLQALHVAGENDAAFPEMGVTPDQFNAFVQRHQPLSQVMTLAIENNDAMRGSYMMVDPLGRFFSNVHGGHRYSAPIWDVGWEEARRQVAIDENKFLARGGLYDWGS
jgi:radical S-adenosyl methionine domain-containing protein 2